MLTNNLKKYIKSLHLKKNREESREFLVEWKKNLIELLNSDFEIVEIFVTEDFYKNNKKLLESKKYYIEKVSDIENISTLESNDSWVAIVKQKENIELKLEKNEFIVILDDIRDPWNLWTIIRTCDWYGIKKIILSKTSVEFYNPKVISGTMWSFSRVSVFYTDLEEYFKDKNGNIFGAFLDWQDVHNVNFWQEWYIIIGNESRWISQNIEKYVNNKITIPRYSNAESLNAWIATWIILDNLKRNK